MNEEYNLDVGFNDILKVDNPILSILSRANGMIDWMVNDIISKEVYAVLKISKAKRPHVEYSTQTWALLLRYGN